MNSVAPHAVGGGWSRRRWAAAMACCGAGAASGVLAQSGGVYPSRSITLVVPWPAGGATDFSMRILGDIAGPQLAHPVIVETRPGAAGTLVVPALRSAAADGYTIGQLPLT